MIINKEIEIYFPDVEFTNEKDEKYFTDLVTETIEEEGIDGLIIALEMYLGK